MTPNLSRYLNKTVFISIPALFEDGSARPYTLLGAEMNGLWLQSQELTDRLLKGECGDLAQMSPVVFVPFAQIAGVLVATRVLPPADECTPQTQLTAATRARRLSADKSAKPAPQPTPPKRKRKTGNPEH